MDIKFVDIFAGPGGLGEGFSRYSEFYSDSVKFRAVQSIEKDPIAAQTLTLRTWLHLQDSDGLPDLYSEFLKDKSKLEEIKQTPEWQRATEIVWNAELGVVSEFELHERLKNSIKGEDNWVLLGGPPCQAYSLIGRARMTGLGVVDENLNDDDIQRMRKSKQDEFLDDHRHELYKEYLRIVAIHQPAVFVMENVKGILSSKIKDGTRIFPQIRQDLHKPAEALSNDCIFKKLAKYHPEENKPYCLYSFVTGRENPDDKEFTIYSENYGVPQKRHRVIILGVREDIRACINALKPSERKSVRQAIEDLPKLRSGLSKGEDSASAWQTAISTFFPEDAKDDLRRKGQEKRLRKILGRDTPCLNRESATATKLSSKSNSPFAKWITTDQPKILLDHQSRGHMTSDLSRYLYAGLVTEVSGVTPKLNTWPFGLLPKHKNVTTDKTGAVKVTGFNDRFRVQAWGLPSTTITSHISKDGHYYIHPDPEQCRSLTVREAARLQTFPDNYFFCGNRTQRYHQVGNAVPPLLAVQLAHTVARIFGK